MSGRVRWDRGASEDLQGSGKEFLTGTQNDQDSVETATRTVGANLEGAGQDEANNVGRIAYERADELAQSATKANQTDARTQEMNDSAIPRMKQFFGGQV